MVEALSTALADRQDVDNEAEDRVWYLRWIGEEDLLFNRLQLILNLIRRRCGLAICYTSASARKLSSQLMRRTWWTGRSRRWHCIVQG